MKNTSSINSALIFLGLLLALVFVSAVPVSAATITTPRTYLNRQRANQTTGQQFDVFFTEASGKTGTDNEVRVIFPDGDDTEWCRTAGAVGVTGITDPEGATETATALLGTLAATCAQGFGSGSAESNADRLLITGVGALVASTKYGVRITDDGGAGVTGTATPAANSIRVEVRTYEDSGTLEDTGILALSLISDDQIVVTAVVDVTLSVSLDTNSINLGTLSTATVDQGGVVSTVSTSASAGYISLVKYNNTLTSTPNTIADTTGGTIVAGTSEYGASSSDSGNTIGVWSPATCGDTGSTSNATALTTSFQSFASDTVAVTAQPITLCFLTSISGTQAPGTYTSTATLVTTARF